jgi:flagellar hook-associated protein 1 FlgK
MTKLDDIADFFISETNAIHKNGYGLDGASTGHDFFIGSSASDIDINPEIVQDNTLIAAAKNLNQPGDNSNATGIIGLRLQKLFESETINVDEYYNNMIVKLGVESQQCTREGENSKLIVDKVKARKESVSGVSLDEELVNMVKYQHSYNAAAKIINVMDELFETLITEMG